MKQLYYTIFCLLTLPFLASCYDDEGGNDFDSPMQDVTMVIPGTAYSGTPVSVNTCTGSPCSPATCNSPVHEEI